MDIVIQQPEVVQEAPRTLVQEAIVYVRECFENLMEDPLGTKRRVWKNYDKEVSMKSENFRKWAEAVTKMADNQANQRFLSSDAPIQEPPFPRPKSMLRK